MRLPSGGDQFIVHYERWEGDESGAYAFVGTHALLIDAAGEVIVGDTELGDIHLPRGDDAFVLGTGAAWVTGDQEQRSLTVHHVTRQADALVLDSNLVP